MAYLYEHRRLDNGEVFYVGIGLTEDCRYTRAHVTNGRNNLWKKVVSKTDYEVNIIIDNLTPDEAKKKEIEIISLYGRKNLRTGTLCNLTSGGDGCLGLIHTDEYKKMMSCLNKGYKHTEEAKIKISESRIGELHYSFGLPTELHPRYGCKHTEETKKAYSLQRKGLRTGSNNYASKLILNKETGIFYVSATEAFMELSLKISLHHFTRMLSGTRKNKTSCIYI